jgi:hypothetical protein
MRSKQIGKPCVVDGVTYESLSAAARAYGLPVATVQMRLLRGRTIEEAVTLAPDEANTSATPITIEGTTYPSVRAAIRAYGMSWNTVMSRVPRGWKLEDAITTSNDARELNQRRTIAL